MYDVCIVGAGVSGASLAGHLATKNVKVALLDVSFEERDRIVGELMQPGGVYMLDQLGLGDVLDEVASCPIHGYALFNKDKHILMDYPAAEGMAGLKGRGLNNGKFIQALRRKSFSSDNISCIQGEVIDFIEMDDHIDGLIYINEKGEKQSLFASLTVVCDGFFSNLRKKLIPENKTITSQFVGVVLENCTLPFEAYGHIFMSGAAPFLCYRISDKEVRLLVDFPVDIDMPKGIDLQHYMLNNILNYMPKVMHESMRAAVASAKFKFMPNHYMSPMACKKTGVVMVGDSLNMRHPLTGGGMTAALTDVMLLSKAIIKEGYLLELDKLNDVIAKYYQDRNEWNASINILADALYKVCLNEELKEACFNYLSRGESFSKEPLQLLSGVSRNNTLLFKHFIQVAFLGAKDNVVNQFGFKSIDNSYEMLKKASQILLPLVMNEGLNLKDLTKNKWINNLASA